MPKSKSAKNGDNRITTNRDNIKHLDILIMDNGDTVTNADSLLTKSAQLRDSIVLFEMNYFSDNFLKQQIERKSDSSIMNQNTSCKLPFFSYTQNRNIGFL